MMLNPRLHFCIARLCSCYINDGFAKLLRGLLSHTAFTRTRTAQNKLNHMCSKGN
ncbi:Uncharacterised protein [Mycobacteroides abscessus subsp. abscessus]|nr:Uncharacterised protein [Mycobacteroides abscessus subsp. abscessus]